MGKSTEKLAVLYADVSGSTRLYEQYGDTIARNDIALCLDMLSNVVTSLGGEVVKTIGDEVMCAFSDPAKAGLAAGEMQAGLRKASEEGCFRMGTLRIKIGWHYGMAYRRDGDLLGEAATTAQQIIHMAKADEILTSAQSVAAMPPMLIPDAALIHRVEAEAWDGELEVYAQPWEQTGEETQIMPAKTAKVLRTVLVLDYRGREYRVDRKNTRCRMGRGTKNDLCVAGNFASRQHAEISYRSDRFYLRDESVNGTVIVDEKGQVKRLRREEDILSGNGTIGLGTLPADDPGGAVRFRLE